jgi:hypothetical protein
MLKKTLSSAVSLLILAGINAPTPTQAKDYVLAQGSNDSITFGYAVTSGGGCRPNDQVISPNGTSLSILFENFVSEGRYEKCNLRIPVTVPDGFFIQDIDVTYQGFKDIKPGGRGFFKSTYSVGADVIRGANENFGPGADTYVIRKPFTIAAFSRCGFDSNIGVNMTAYASNGSMVALDTVDFQAGEVRLDFKIARCRR